MDYELFISILSGRHVAGYACDQLNGESPASVLASRYEAGSTEFRAEICELTARALNASGSLGANVYSELVLFIQLAPISTPQVRAAALFILAQDINQAIKPGAALVLRSLFPGCVREKFWVKELSKPWVEDYPGIVFAGIASVNVDLAFGLIPTILQTCGDGKVQKIFNVAVSVCGDKKKVDSLFNTVKPLLSKEDRETLSRLVPPW